jgi:transcriptional regulator with XRE-family HTH domain
MQGMSRRKQPNPDAEAFGAIVRRLRTKHGLTQEKLAELADLNVSYIGFLERGENVPTLTIVLNLAGALDVNPADLVREVAATRQQNG